MVIFNGAVNDTVSEEQDDNKNKDNKDHIDPIQGPLVRQAFELYATEQYTLHTLCSHMEQLGLKNIVKKRVNINSLSVMLNNSFYIGILRVKEMNFDGGHEPLISPDLFKRVQAILRGNTNQKINKHEYKFRKLISCNSCGYSLIAETQKGHIYYRCHTKECTTKGMREVTVENFLLKAFTATQLLPEESAILDELLRDMESDWITKQKDMLTALRLQKGQIEQGLERLTDCYVEGGLDKETYEQRKQKLLMESKEKQAAEREINLGKDKLFRRVKKILELGKNLKKSYEMGISEEQREFVQMATSNLVVNCKKLDISMRSPFLELSQRHNLLLGEPGRDAPRKVYTHFCYSEQNTSPIIGEPLNREQLKSLLDLIMEAVSQLPDSNNETEYAI